MMTGVGILFASYVVVWLTMRMRPLYGETVAKGDIMWWLNEAVNKRFGWQNLDILIIPSTCPHGIRKLHWWNVYRAAFNREIW